MRVVVQRVTSSKVVVDGKTIGEIKKGFNLLIGISKEDTIEDLKYIKDKVVNLRVFEDENDKLNLSLLDIKGEILAISQFTLYGDCRKGRRP
ncbi:MAG: D-aminoacyl-tRNA deacylase, partial [Clostridium sp.]